MAVYSGISGKIGAAVGVALIWSTESSILAAMNIRHLSQRWDPALTEGLNFELFTETFVGLGADFGWDDGMCRTCLRTRL